MAGKEAQISSAARLAQDVHPPEAAQAVLAY